MLGQLNVTTHMRVYCAGPPHNHAHFIFDGYATEHHVEGIVRAAGFRQTPDGRWWCGQHKPRTTKKGNAS